jgi:hypothetical protein
VFVSVQLTAKACRGTATKGAREIDKCRGKKEENFKARLKNNTKRRAHTEDQRGKRWQEDHQPRAANHGWATPTVIDLMDLVESNHTKPHQRRSGFFGFCDVVLMIHSPEVAVLLAVPKRGAAR